MKVPCLFSDLFEGQHSAIGPSFGVYDYTFSYLMNTKLYTSCKQLHRNASINTNVTCKPLTVAAYMIKTLLPKFPKSE